MSDPLLNVMKIMLLAALYLFFLRVLWAVYNELREPRTRVAARAQRAGTPVRPAKAAGAVGSSTIRLGSSGRRGRTAVIVGQLTVIRPAALAGTTFALANEMTIGRAPTCGVHLDDSYASQVHARTFFTGERFFIEDLGSSNGTTLNGRRLEATSALTAGDIVEIGATVMEFS